MADRIGRLVRAGRRLGGALIVGRGRRRLIAGLALALGGTTLADRAAAAAPTCLRPPVEAEVVDPFREPPCPFCPGNRGIEYGPAEGTPVVAAEAGRITFAGLVAGTRYVVVDHGDGWRTTYGKLATVAVRLGQSVTTGERLGTSSAALFFGLRQGETYVDPTGRLARLVARPQLVPLDGEHRRPPRPAKLVCPPG